MAQVVASTRARSGAVQQDGRQWVTEVFIIDDGTTRQSVYLAEAGAPDADLDSHLAEMVTGWNQTLADGG